MVKAKTKAAVASTGRAGYMRGGPPPSHLEQEYREAEDGGRSEIAWAELEQQQRRCKLLTKHMVGRREQGMAGLGWGGVTSHALLPNLVSTCEISKSLAVPAGGSGAASRRRGSASGCIVRRNAHAHQRAATTQKVYCFFRQNSINRPKKALRANTEK